jgi:hypothetical protein
MAAKPAKKPAFKGKYPGPDELKGDPAKLAIWEAAKRRSKNPAKPAPPLDSTAAQPTTPVGTSPTGGIDLQSNIDIETAVLDAATAQKKAESDSARLKTEALLDYQRSASNADSTDAEARGRVNANSAYRGLKGTTAAMKSENAETDIALNRQAISSAKQAKEGYADGVVTAANQSKISTDTWAAGQRLAYTAQRSRENPTAGTSPVNAGVSGTSPIAEMAPKKGYKGAYKGPDIFKGDKALNAAWRRAAKRKAGKK